MKIRSHIKNLDGLRDKLVKIKSSISEIENSAVINQLFRKINDALRVNKTDIHLLDFTTDKSFSNPTEMIIDRVKLSIIPLVITDLEEPIDSNSKILVVDKDEINENLINTIEAFQKQNLNYCIINTSSETESVLTRSIAIPKQSLFHLDHDNPKLENIIAHVDQTFSLIHPHFNSIIIRVNKLFKVLTQQIDLQVKNLKAKHILNHGEFIEMQYSDIRKLNKYSALLKTTISKQVKQINASIAQSTNFYLIENNEQNGLIAEEIMRYDGFLEKDLSKQQKLQITEGFIDGLNIKLKESVELKIQNETTFINEQIDSLKQVLNEYLKEIEVPQLSHIDGLTNVFDQVSEGVQKPISEFEKSFSKKGLSTLFMDLRTPLFMLMPLLMIGGLLGALLKTTDVATINEDIQNINGKEVIVIKDYPKTWYTDFVPSHRKFESMLNKSLNDGTFELNEMELLMYSSIPDKRSNRVNKQADLVIDHKNQQSILYILGDRSEVLSRLMDPNNNLLAVGGRTRMSMGYAMIFTLINKVPNKKLVFYLLIGLIAYYIRKKYVSFSVEAKESQDKEKSTLKRSLNSELHKFRSALLSKWKMLSADELKLTQESISKEVEMFVQEKIEEEKFKLQQMKILHDKRAKSFKDREKKLIESRSEVVQLQKEIEKFNAQPFS